MTATKSPNALRAAFEATAADRACVDLNGAPAYTLDATYASLQAVGIIDRLAPYQERIRRLPELDLRKIDRFPLYADALQFVQAILVLRVARAKEMPELAARGWKVREIMMKYLELLVAVGKVDGKLVERLRAGSGYADLVEDLTALIEFFGAAPDLTAADSFVTPDALQTAVEILNALRQKAAIDGDLDLSRGQLVAERHKLGLLLLASHREIRRAVDYLRHYEGDAASLVPSLYVPTKGRRTTAAAPTLAAVHDELHSQVPAHDNHEPLDPEDNPFAPDED